MFMRKYEEGKNKFVHILVKIRYEKKNINIENVLKIHFMKNQKCFISNIYFILYFFI